MDDLSSRLLAAIEETERKATRTAEQDEWDESPHDRLRLVINDRYPTALYDDEDYPRGPLLAVLSLADPSSVLRRCAADRRRLERHAPTEPGIGHFGSARFKDPSARICSHCSHDGDWGATPWPCPDIVDLADSYGLEVTE